MSRESNDYFGPNNKIVKELSPLNFDSTAPWLLKDIDGKKPCGMVLFYAPWCGHCKAVAPTFLNAAKTVGFCDYYAFNCEKYGAHLAKIKEDKPELVPSFPTIIIYKNGKPVEFYVDDRTEEAFIKKCMETKCKK